MRYKIKPINEIIELYKSYGCTFEDDYSKVFIPNGDVEGYDFVEKEIAGKIVDLEEYVFDTNEEWQTTFNSCKFLRMNNSGECLPIVIVTSIKEKLDKLLKEE